MADTRDSPAEVVTDLVRQLEAEARLIDGGGFTLDIAAMRRELAEFRVASPHAFVLLLVEAAHLLRGCSEIEFSSAARRTCVRLVGASLSAAELSSLFEVLFVDSTSRDSAARHELGRQRLALAIDAAVVQPGVQVELHAVSTDQRELVVSFDRDGQTVRDTPSPPGAAASLTLDVRRRRGRRAAVREQRALLEAHARYADRPVIVDGERLNLATALQDVVEPVEIRSATGQPIGRAGCSPARLQGTATIILIANGVVIEVLHELRWQPNFVALVDVGDLRRDLSLTKLVRDEAFAARIDAVRAVHDALADNSEIEVSYAGRHPLHPTSSLVISSTAFAGAIAIGAAGLNLLPFAIGVGMIGIPFLIGAIASRARSRGLRAVGQIESMTQEDQGKFGHVLTLTLRIWIPDRAPVRASSSSLTNAAVLDRLEPGAYVHVRVDPRDDARVWLDVPPT